MITVYLAGIPNYYEGEDYEIRYAIYQENKLIEKKSCYREYVKPKLVGIHSLLYLFDVLSKYHGPIKLIYNDAALNQIVRDNSGTKNGEVLKLASILKRKLKKFTQGINLIDISNNYQEIAQWNEILKP